jgi:pilus assembly protein CpaD
LVLRAAIVAGCGLLACGCNTDQQVAGVPSVPTDVRMRHPITITEAPRTMQLFIGANRGALNPSQRAEVLEFAQTWKNEATGGVLIDLPTGTSNQYAAADALREIQSILAATGVPPQSMMVRTYAAGAATLATVRPPIRKSSPRPVPAACGPRTSGRASTATISKTSRTGTWAAPTSTISPP